MLETWDRVCGTEQLPGPHIIGTGGIEAALGDVHRTLGVLQIPCSAGGALTRGKEALGLPWGNFGALGV